MQHGQGGFGFQMKHNYLCCDFVLWKTPYSEEIHVPVYHWCVLTFGHLITGLNSWDGLISGLVLSKDTTVYNQFYTGIFCCLGCNQSIKIHVQQGSVYVLRKPGSIIVMLLEPEWILTATGMSAMRVLVVCGLPVSLYPNRIFIIQPGIIYSGTVSGKKCKSKTEDNHEKTSD